MATCAGPACPLQGSEIPWGERRIDATVTVNWGEADLRADWTGVYSFCSFRCVADYATGRAGEHDGVTLVEGKDERRGRVDGA
jgi:hypothetical protein